MLTMAKYKNRYLRTVEADEKWVLVERGKTFTQTQVKMNGFGLYICPSISQIWEYKS